MKTEHERRNSRLWILGAVPLLMLVLLSGTGLTLAHYKSSVTKTQDMKYQASTSQIYLLSSERDEDGKFLRDEDGNIMAPVGWKSHVDVPGGQIADLYTMDFLLSNGKNEESVSDYTQNASLALFATVGIKDPDQLEIILTDSRSDYTAVPTEVKEGSAWYRRYGQGWIYRFYNEAGEELTWSLTGGVLAYQQMTLTVKGSGQNVAMLNLVASARPESV